MSAEQSTSGIKQDWPLPGTPWLRLPSQRGQAAGYKVLQFGGRRMSDRGHTSSGWSWTCVGWCLRFCCHLWQSLVRGWQPYCERLCRACWHPCIVIWSPICPILIGPSSGWRLTSYHSQYTLIWQQPRCFLDTVLRVWRPGACCVITWSLKVSMDLTGDK